MEWIETTGSTVDEAKDRALDRLGIAEDDMQFEIIDEGSSSLFRLKRKEARLRARVKPVNTKPKFDRRSKNKQQGRPVKNGSKPGNSKNNNPKKNSKKETVQESNKNSLNNMRKKVHPTPQYHLYFQKISLKQYLSYVDQTTYKCSFYQRCYLIYFL